MSALRSLLRSPAFTVVALLTLALGIGVNTAMFSVVQTLLFAPGPFPDAERLVRITATAPHGDQPTFSAIEAGEIRAQAQAFHSLTTFTTGYPVVAENDRPTVRLSSIHASPDLFTTFGVQPMLGRAFTSDEARPGHDGVIVLSHRCWQTRYAGAPDIVGRSLRIDSVPVEIIGVMPPDFDHLPLWKNTQFWRPFVVPEEQSASRQVRLFTLIGRLVPSIDPAQAGAELALLATQQAATYPEIYTDFDYRVRALHETLTDPIVRQVSWMLLALSGFVLLIACANLAHLQLARAATRARELAIRSALGASRGRLVLHQLTESVGLSLGGGALSLFVAGGIHHVAAQHFAIGTRPRLPIPIDSSILLITLAVSLLVGVIFGLVPAWLASRTAMNAVLKSQGRGSTASRGHRWIRHSLIVIEVALALVLLGGAGIMHRGFAQFLAQDNGWDTEQVLTALVGLPPGFGGATERWTYFQRLETRLAALPGVEHAALATSLPIHGYGTERPFLNDGQTAADAARLANTQQTLVTADYFAAMGIPVIIGQTFGRDLPPESPRVGIINQSLARHLWPNASAVGRHFTTLEGSVPVSYEIIGVVGDVQTAAALASPATPFTLYRPLSQQPWPWVNLVVRSRTPAALADSLRRAASEVDPEVPADLVATVSAAVAWAHHDLRLAGRALSAFAGLGLLLAAVGIYGVISSLVAQRTPEFGIRLALGAQPRQVLAMVIRHGLTLTAIGLALGLGGAYALARVLGSFMPRLAGPEPAAFAVVSVLVMIVALAACLVPARRATKVDPIAALRAD